MGTCQAEPLLSVTESESGDAFFRQSLLSVRERGKNQEVLLWGNGNFLLREGV